MTPDPNAMREVRRAAELAVRDATEHLLEEANRTAPIEEGTLIRSGRATTDGLRGVVSYDTPYAVRQHEDTRLKHRNGRRAKWGERTFAEEAQRIGEFLGARMRRSL